MDIRTMPFHKIFEGGLNVVEIGYTPPILWSVNLILLQKEPVPSCLGWDYQGYQVQMGPGIERLERDTLRVGLFGPRVHEKDEVAMMGTDKGTRFFYRNKHPKIDPLMSGLVELVTHNNIQRGDLLESQGVIDYLHRMFSGADKPYL